MDIANDRPYLKWLFWILLFKALCAVVMITTGPIHLVPDEAQYWLWSKNLDWGYYSKPPGIALSIAAGTWVFGDTELGVRFGAIIISFATGVAVYFLAQACRLSKQASFWAALVMALSPMGLIGSIYATTDWGLLLFWTLAFIVLIREEHPSKYVLLGLCIFFGALFKWTMFIIWIPLIVYAFYDRRWMNKGLIVTALISAIALLPSVIWNASHDWVTFKHVWTQSTGGDIASSRSWSGNPLDFLGAQVMLLSPIFFFLFCAGVISYKHAPRPVKFCGWLCATILIVYLLMACLTKMQGNWAMYAFPTGVIILSWYALYRLKRGTLWLKIGTAVSLLLFTAAISIPILQSQPEESSVQIPFKSNPFKANLGWNKLPEILKHAGYDPSTQFLAADKYQTSSLLSFYSEGQKRAYFLNLFARRKNQFSFWPTMDKEQLGKSGYFVVIEDQIRPKIQADQLRLTYEEKLAPYFNSVRFVGIYPLFYAYGVPVKWAMLFFCDNYNGLIPQDPKKY